MSVKDKIKKEANGEWTEFELTPNESSYINYVNDTTQQEIAGFLSIISTLRFGYPENTPLQYDLNFADPERKIKVRLVPENIPEP
jgi:hypothetical protein